MTVLLRQMPNRPIGRSISRSISRSVNKSVNQSVGQSIGKSIGLPAKVSMHPPGRPSDVRLYSKRVGDGVNIRTSPDEQRRSPTPAPPSDTLRVPIARISHSRFSPHAVSTHAQHTMTAAHHEISTSSPGQYESEHLVAFPPPRTSLGTLHDILDVAVHSTRACARGFILPMRARLSARPPSLHDPSSDAGSLENYIIHCVHRDRHGGLWCGFVLVGNVQCVSRDARPMEVPRRRPSRTAAREPSPDRCGGGRTRARGMASCESVRSVEGCVIRAVTQQFEGRRRPVGPGGGGRTKRRRRLGSRSGSGGAATRRAPSDRRAPSSGGVFLSFFF